MNNEAYISLGSNIGDRSHFLESAIDCLVNDENIQVVNVSSIYETDPVGFEDQAPFLNMVLKLETNFKPEELLDRLLKIEKKFGRKRDIRWGPRTLDLDILLYNKENIESEKLTIPHPRMLERAFVIIPLLEIHPTIKIPKMEIHLNSFLQNIRDREGVRIWKQKNGEDVFALFAN
ncbi:2-amino-4-hydroxy-6-hydroxymethyldihydropteridine diphosphokinase [Cytobacillus spongiae]|uniref:2-amino-4-hydroxy-6- hydroxymethyldihydropteridine diphosphokinase n=1 Tax=Cytobacillus spongiae TaxID=2901381 RepID=UPI001F162B98|nr:2-amino-4-hydroxy-6-hydroxymethyldihydropteridine diphosphokinase [Cytobacillus spongiae]UII56038.1 2-amino-4-hydroxy-6-hydroxymethyldihydropteridine diphosphokinase [Cytobacillus spongiae]